VAFVAESDSAYNAATIAVLVALLLPAVNAAREAARRNGAMNQLKQLSLAMLNYEAIHKTFPAQANYDAAGKPLLSWRVHILPFLEQKELYQQFHLDEPWDSEHNLKLIDKMPDLYANPNLDEPGKTNFLVPVGEGTVFDSKTGRRFRDITDGTSNTLLIVEANADRAVIWTRPDDLPFDPSNPLAGLGQLRPGGFLAARCDGSIGFLPLDLAAERITAMFTRAAGDAVR
jgi:hypothetical protein